MPRQRFDRDYYRVMGLGPEATEDEVRRAYRRLALEWHPDRNPGNPAAEERFKEISEAYAVLIDPAKRREYDLARRSGAPGGFRHSQEDIFRDLFASPRASAIFEDLAREFARLGLRIDRQQFQRTLFGGRAVVVGGVFVISPLTPLLLLARLAGAALRAGTGPTPATLPGAPRPRGLLGRLGRWLLGPPSEAAPAPPVAADDVVLPLRLSAGEAEAGGRKRLRLEHAGTPDELLVTVPARVRAGTRLRVPGRGRIRGDGSRGDLYLAIEVADRA